MAKERKYPTYKALAEAFKKGELKDYVLVLDNDACRLSFRGDKPANISEDAWELECDHRYEEYHEWFEGNGRYDMADMCDALGIPSEPA